MDKRAELSLNVIIVAVIALIVLVILVLIFTGKTKIFTTQTSDTAGEYTGKKCVVPGTNNQCLDEYTCKDQKGSFQRGQYTDCDYYGGCCFM